MGAQSVCLIPSQFAPPTLSCHCAAMADENGSTPSWYDAVRKWERTIGQPIEQVVRSETFFDAVTQARRVQAEIGKRVESLTEDWFRMLNLPAGSEIRRLREQLGRVERTLERVANDLADARADGDAPPPARSIEE
jgi:hypothetical protein